MNNIYNLIDEMESYFDTCSKAFMSNKRVVDADVIYEFMTDLRNKLPEEIRQSQRIVNDKEKILSDAKQQANEANLEAETRIAKLVNEHEIMQKAYKESEFVIAEAKNTARELKLGAYEYIDELIAHFEAAVNDTLEESSQCHRRYEEYMHKQLQVLQTNRAELHERKSGKK